MPKSINNMPKNFNFLNSRKLGNVFKWFSFFVQIQSTIIYKVKKNMSVFFNIFFPLVYFITGFLLRWFAECWNAPIRRILFANSRHNILVFESLLRTGCCWWRLDGKFHDLILFILSVFFTISTSIKQYQCSRGKKNMK